MKVSAVGFLFQEKLKGKGLKGKNYNCTIHKINPDGNYNKNVISSPIVKNSQTEVISPDRAESDILKSLSAVADSKPRNKFIGATIKDGIKETEIHSVLSDKLYAVRTRDEMGKNHFHIMNRNKTKNILAQNLYLNA